MLIEAPSLAQPGIRHAFFTRLGGASSGIYASLNGGLGSADDPDAVRENRARMATALGVPSGNLVSLHQVHSSDVVMVEAPWSGDGRPKADERPKADGMATRVPGLALAILTADCGPVLFADAEGGVVGACHAGWKGALGGVIEATIDRMVALGAARRRIAAVLGPTIGPNAYEVGPDYRDRFLAADAGHATYFRPSGRAEHWLFDLPAFIAARLAAAGIGGATSLDLCTYSEPERFYSYRMTTHRGEPDYGRLVSAIALAGPDQIG